MRGQRSSDAGRRRRVRARGRQTVVEVRGMVGASAKVLPSRACSTPGPGDSNSPPLRESTDRWRSGPGAHRPSPSWPPPPPCDQEGRVREKKIGIGENRRDKLRAAPSSLLLRLEKELASSQVQGSSYSFQVVEGDVRLASLDRSHVGTVNPTPVCKGLLRVPCRSPQSPDRTPQLGS